MRKDCQNLRREIDEGTPGRLRSPFANRHMKVCPECKSYADTSVNLQELLASLGTVEAPGDFDFRLRARLAGEKPAGAHFPLNGLSFGLRSAVVATLFVVFGSALFVALRNSPENTSTADNQTPAVAVPSSPVTPSATALAAVTTNPVANKDAETAAPRNNPRPALHSSRNSRMGTRELASRPATIIKASDLNASAADYPIEASTQPVRVSLDNGRGNSRTISLPPVSFGSQRVMSQGSAPLIASARGSW